MTASAHFQVSRPALLDRPERYIGDNDLFEILGYSDFAARRGSGASGDFRPFGVFFRNVVIGADFAKTAFSANSQLATAFAFRS
jgi:hypothetical protein